MTAIISSFEPNLPALKYYTHVDLHVTFLSERQHLIAVWLHRAGPVVQNARKRAAAPLIDTCTDPLLSVDTPLRVGLISASEVLHQAANSGFDDGHCG